MEFQHGRDYKQLLEKKGKLIEGLVIHVKLM